MSHLIWVVRGRVAVSAPVLAGRRVRAMRIVRRRVAVGLTGVLPAAAVALLAAAAAAAATSSCGVQTLTRDCLCHPGAVAPQGRCAGACARPQQPRG